MKRTMLLLATVMVVCALFFAGCVSKTPKAEIPPPVSTPAVVPPPGSDNIQPWPDNFPTAGKEPDQQAEKNKEIIRRFKEAYHAAGSPRIAIFFNRRLSDDVREWAADERTAVTTNGVVRSKGRESKIGIEGKTTETGRNLQTQYEIRQTVGRERYIGTEGELLSMEDSQIWAFEEGFIRPFLEAGATIVDRTAILRLAAANSSDQNNPQIKKLEIDALRNHTDMFVEIMITRGQARKSNYEFRAVAKQVKTGVIVGQASSIQWDTKFENRRVAVPTSTGYQFQERKKNVTQMDRTAETLAIDLMISLMNKWGVTAPTCEGG